MKIETVLSPLIYEISTVLSRFLVQLSVWIDGNTVWPNQKWKNSRWRPRISNIYYRSQTRYQRNSNGYTHVFGIQLPIGTRGNTMQPNRKRKNPRWRSLSCKCMLGLQNDVYLSTLPPPGKSKWRPQSLECVCLSILTTYKLHMSASIADSNTIVTATSIVEVQQLDGTIIHYTRHKGSSEIQDDGLQTGSTYISACGRDKHAITSFFVFKNQIVWGWVQWEHSPKPTSQGKMWTFSSAWVVKN